MNFMRGPPKSRQTIMMGATPTMDQISRFRSSSRWSPNGMTVIGSNPGSPRFPDDPRAIGEDIAPGA